MRRCSLRTLFAGLFLLLIAFGAGAQTYLLQQSAGAYVYIRLVANTDHTSGLTGQTGTGYLSRLDVSAGTVTKAATTNNISEVDSANSPGLYKLQLTSTETGTAGFGDVYYKSANSDPANTHFQIIPGNPFDGTRFGLTALPNAAAAASGGLPTVDANNAVKVQSGTGANQISLSSGLVTVGTNNDKTGYTASTVSDKTGYSLSATQTFNLTGSITGSLSGSVGSVTAAPSDSSGVTTLLTRIPGTVQPQTGDSYALLGTPAGASVSADVAANLTAINTRAATSALPTNFSALSITAGGLVAINLAQALGASPWDTTTIGDSFKAGWTQGVGKWVISATAHTLTLYAPDGTTVLKSFAILPVPTVNASRQ